MPAKNLHELNKDLLSLYGELREGTIDARNATALANVAGKIIKSAKTIMEYNIVKKDIDKIPVLENK